MRDRIVLRMKPRWSPLLYWSLWRARRRAEPFRLDPAEMAEKIARIRRTHLRRPPDA